MALLRKLALFFSTLALAIALSPPAANAANPSGSRFSGSLSGTSTVHFVVEPPPQFPGTLCNLTTPCAVGTGTATGRFSHLGQVSVTGNFAARFTGDGNFTDAGELVMTAKGGTLAIAFVGSGHVTSVGEFVIGSTTEATVTEHIIAGTGKFVGVTGTATAEQSGTLTSIALGTNCFGALNSPCLQFTSFDSSVWNGTINL